MLVVHKLKGKIEGRKIVFSERVVKLHRGKVALAKGAEAPKNETVPTGPWGPQIPWINMLFNEAGELYSGGAPKFYPGSTVAEVPGLVGQSRDAAVGQINTNAPQNTAVAGQAAANAGGAYANPVATTAAGLNPNLTAALTNLTGGGTPGPLGGVQNPATAAVGTALNAPGQTQQNVYSAPGVAAGGLDVNPALQGQLNGQMSPYLQQIVEGALRSSNNNFQRNVMSAIGDAASQAGQVGGTRQGIAQGIAAADLAATQNDMITRIYQQAFDSMNADRNAAIQTVVGAQGQNAQNQLATNQLNEAVRAAIMGETLNAGQIGAGLLGQSAQLGQQGQISGTNILSQLLTQGQALGTDAFTKNAAIMPLLQQANLGQLGFANELGVQQYGFDQAAIDADVERYFYEQYAPFNLLTQFQNYISGPYGSSVAGAPNQTTNQVTGQLNPYSVPGRRSRNQSALFGDGSFTNLDNDPVTGLPSPWKWF